MNSSHLGRYLRAQNSYDPPANVQGIVEELKTASNTKTGCNGTQFSLADKFSFLMQCADKFQHPVPNSVLHEINTIGNVCSMSLILMKLCTIQLHAVQLIVISIFRSR